MKVKELVELLLTFDQEARIFYTDDGGDVHDVDHVHHFKPAQATVIEENEETKNGNYTRTKAPKRRYEYETCEIGEHVVTFAPSF